MASDERRLLSARLADFFMEVDRNGWGESYPEDEIPKAREAKP